MILWYNIVVKSQEEEKDGILCKGIWQQQRVVAIFSDKRAFEWYMDDKDPLAGTDMTTKNTVTASHFLSDYGLYILLDQMHSNEWWSQTSVV